MTTFTREKYKELSNSSLVELSHMTDIDNVKKLALLLRAELYASEANVEYLEADRVAYEEGRKLICEENDKLEAERDNLIQIIRDMNVNNLDYRKAQVVDSIGNSK